MPTLSVEHCMLRAERYRLRIFTTNDPAVAERLLNISHKYRQLAADAHEALHGAGDTNEQLHSNLHFLHHPVH
jgi:hypothetical protein